ncbi:MAG: type II secretion system protein GspN [Deltaproteobacteria bacterium]|nr:type II secretion system protein GspN [Deltaproteobacteria bacterium]
MQAFKRNNRYWYLVYIAVLLILFLYVMFPDRVLNSFLSAQAEKRFPDLNISFEDTGFILPLGIKIKGLEVALKDNPYVPIYVSEKTSIRVSITGLFFGGNKVTFTSRVNGGEISGVFEERDKESCNITVDIDDIILDGRPFIHPDTGKYIEGMVSGRISFTGNPSDFIKGKGDISLEVNKGRIKPAMPLFDIRDIGFERISIAGALDKMRFTIKDMSMKGGPFNGSARGDVQLNRDIFSSGLMLSAKITPGPSMEKDIPDVARAIKSSGIMKNGRLIFDIEGTLTKPLPVIR